MSLIRVAIKAHSCLRNYFIHLLSLGIFKIDMASGGKILQTEIKYLEKYELWVGDVLESAIKAENGEKDLNNALNSVLSRYLWNYVVT